MSDARRRRNMMTVHVIVNEHNSVLLVEVFVNKISNCLILLWVKIVWKVVLVKRRSLSG